METRTASPAEMANAIRALAMDAVERANSGHPGMPMGMADVATVLFTRHATFDPSHARWPNRDRFVLSNGHGSMLLYALLHLLGYPDVSMEDLARFRQLGSKTAGHPEHGHALGIETTTGPLGQGFANAVGMALAERMLSARFGEDLVDHRTWVVVGDGCLMEGISHEAASLAGHLKLNKLVALFDDNDITIDGPTSIAVSDDQMKRFDAYGWTTLSVDGHDVEAVDRALTEAKASERPVFIACKTVIGKGAPGKAGKSAAHGSALGPDEVAATRQALGWTHGPFELPDHVEAAWREAGRRGAAEQAAWSRRLEAADPALREEFLRVLDGNLPSDFDERVRAYKRQLMTERPKVATRKASQNTLEILIPAVPELVGGSADLTGSNNTKVGGMGGVAPGDMKARHVHWGVREHAMMAAMNGIALHRGFIPYGGTFLAFVDYCRPAIRLAALMQQRVILVATHDSIGLGEDGPTHQPVEQLASLRAIPNVLVFRPADAIETVECWQAAIENARGPSVLALTRQNLPTLREDETGENLSARGAYVLREAEGGGRRATILATGSEVEIAVEARRILQGENVPTAVVSMPCQELFERQDGAWRETVLGCAPRVAVEAGTPFGWTRYVASEGDVVGMTSFGASGPFDELYEHFGITAKAVAERARRLLA